MHSLKYLIRVRRPENKYVLALTRVSGGLCRFLSDAQLSSSAGKPVSDAGTSDTTMLHCDQVFASNEVITRERKLIDELESHSKQDTHEAVSTLA